MVHFPPPALYYRNLESKWVRGFFFYKGLEFQWNFCGKLYDPKTRVLYIAFFIHINYYIVI